MIITRLIRTLPYVAFAAICALAFCWLTGTPIILGALAVMTLLTAIIWRINATRHEWDALEARFAAHGKDIRNHMD